MEPRKGGEDDGVVGAYAFAVGIALVRIVGINGREDKCRKGGERGCVCEAGESGRASR